jgi:hypothetical protein
VAQLFRAEHLSIVVGLRLADGREVVVKARPVSARVPACTAVQRVLARAGYSCPRPLVDPARWQGLLVTAEEYLPGGHQLPAGPGAAQRFARLLAHLVRLAPAAGGLAALRPSPPWVGWDHPGRRLWPAPDDRREDLNTVPGPAWLDAAAGQVRAC